MDSTRDAVDGPVVELGKGVLLVDGSLLHVTDGSGLDDVGHLDSLDGLVLKGAASREWVSSLSGERCRFGRGRASRRDGDIWEDCGLLLIEAKFFIASSKCDHSSIPQIPISPPNPHSPALEFDPERTLGMHRAQLVHRRNPT